MSDPSESSRRQSRFLASLPATLCHGGEEHPCEALNLSRSGVLLVGALPRPEEPDLELRIATATGDLELRAVARVVHVQQDAEQGETKIGLQFTELDAAQNRTVDLLVARIVEGRAPAALERLPRGASAAESREALKKVSAAHRVALALRGQAREREFLRRDPDPNVLQALVRNPRITLPEIINIARVPHLLPTTLEIMATDPRWLQDDELKIMIATHPRVTFQTADRIVSGMSDILLQRLLSRSGLQPAVRAKLMARLTRKHRG